MKTQCRGCGILGTVSIESADMKGVDIGSINTKRWRVYLKHNKITKRRFYLTIKYTYFRRDLY